MVTNDLGACEWFVWDLRRSALIDRGQLDQIVSEFLKKNPRAEAPALAEYLVKHGSLTAFQAERILNGKSAGLVLGPYVLTDAIGQGSMGQVFKATSKNDNAAYAVKVLPRRSMWNVRLARRQVRSFGQFQHPAVVPFVDVGTAGGLHYLVWPLADGVTLESQVQQNGKLPAADAALTGVQVAQGLYASHQNGVFHGLLKPSNVMVGPDGQARILDLGIGSLLVENDGESLVDTMSTANTLTSGLDCASPESIMDPTQRTPAGDQYSLGCTLYYCLTGRVPFPEGSAVEKMMAHQSKEPVAIADFAPDCPEGLAAVVARLMAKKPDDRYSGMDEVVEALEPYLGELAGAVEQPSAARMTAAGSNGRMNGVNARGGAATANRSGFATAAQAPTQSQTPPPASRPAATLPSRASVAAPPRGPSTPPPAPPRTHPQPPASTRPLPGRAAVQPAAHQDAVPLTAAPPAAEPSRMSAGWTAGAEPERKKPAFGLLGVAALVLILGVLVYLGLKLLNVIP